MTTKQLVLIKGTKEGLVLQLDDQCAYSDLLDELKRKVKEEGLEGQAEVTIHVGNRYCNQEQLKEILHIVQESKSLKVTKIKSDVITMEECNEKLLRNQSSTYIGIVRSGQEIKADGDLVVIGDVNPNGKVVAGGSIYVMGRLKGMAHAGFNGNRDSVIAASWLEATHLMIADLMELMTNEITILANKPEMECAYIHTNGRIAIDRLQDLRNLRPNLSTFKGGS
ncbi:septum site-determining protein MinC [Rummeliibacillus stabekisii]|uniref:septum site-determining protein MinC n=1 Tax=Rummeliibacillus stabekisii TaxID=241244 RepID=UPI00203B81F6|nr:septum site-determining protein MinC [Rummeliibacillus stabekisii]MCM3316862.1 septum site-determining protein MinC [Rummeliibacillus stabekisii]